MFWFSMPGNVEGYWLHIKGVCGKTEDVAKLQDLLIYTL